MIDYLGLIISGLSTIFFSINNPWERRIRIIGLPYSYVGILLLVAGIIVSGITTHLINLEKREYKNQIDTIDINVKNTLSIANQGFNTLLYEYEDKTNQLIKNYDILISTIIDQSDSSLNSALLKIRQDYQKLNAEYLIEKDLTHRYYFAEQWPWSDKDDDISSALFFFVPTELSGLITGQDRYIIWYLIERNGSFPYNQIVNLHDEMWTKLEPMTLSISINLKRLELLKIIKPDYWKGNIKFTNNFINRLEVFNEYKNTGYKNTDMYVQKLFKLEMGK